MVGSEPLKSDVYIEARMEVHYLYTCVLCNTTRRMLSTMGQVGVNLTCHTLNAGPRTVGLLHVQRWGVR